jgi:hypothetical protein
VWERLSAAINDPALIHAQWQAAREAGPDPRLATDRESATHTLERLTRQQERLVRRLREADDDIADLIEREIAAIERERKGLKATLAEIDARLAVRQDGVDRLALAALNVRVDASGPESGGMWRMHGSVPLEATPGLGAVSPSSG